MGRGRARAGQRRPDDVVVPDLLGLTVLEAEETTTMVGLQLVGPDPDFALLSDLHGTVVRQEPAPGATVEHGATVMVWTSGPGGEAGVREPRRPFPPVVENRAAADLEADGVL